jgi:2-polyprenyl-6-methoxyphenol hydroxylase-like FAD-dependent oxidoreductase
MEAEMKQNKGSQTPFGHAVVIGGSIAGLTVARVLIDYFTQVTIIERDRLPDAPHFRRGVPQARHAHTLPLRGQVMLEEQFPGLADELITNGAVPINGGSEMAFFIAGGWHEVRHQAGLVSMTCSRPLLENTIYRRLVNHPRVQIIQEQSVVGLAVDKRERRVTGVHLRSRGGSSINEIRLAADLVIDASGRESRAPQWLADLGFTPPLETTINAFPGYATRVYRRPATFAGNWKTLYIRPTPPDRTRGGVIIPIEGDRWLVTLIGMAGDCPPTDEAGFLAFAQTLPVPQLAEAIKEAEPLSLPYGYRNIENRVRHYEKLPRYLEGFIVCGDAAYALNPVYAQGMTAAVMGSQALAYCLKKQSEKNHLAGLAQAFQAQLSRIVADPWQLSVREDQRWPVTKVIKEAMPAWIQLPSPKPGERSATASYNLAW